MLRLAPRRKPAPPVDRAGKVYPGRGRSAGGGWRCCPAASSRCWRPRSTRRRSACSPAMASRSWCRRARAAAARWSIIWAARSRRWPRPRNNIDAWTREIEGGGLDAIVITASGCGTTVKDYGFMLRTIRPMPTRPRASRALAKDITEYLADARPAGSRRRSPALTVAYHAACSLQHGQKITRAAEGAASKAGFMVKDVPEGHLCCGSAGTYNILQPELRRGCASARSPTSKRLGPMSIAAGNIGCITQIAARHADPGRAYGRAARLGHRRSGARAACCSR